MHNAFSQAAQSALEQLKESLAQLAFAAATPSETIIARCVAEPGIATFFRQHSSELFQQWTRQYTRTVRVAELFQQLTPLLFVAQQCSTQQVVADYCFSLWLQQILKIERDGQYLLNGMLEAKPSSLALLKQFDSAGELRLESLEIIQQGNSAAITFLNGHNLHAEDGQFVEDLETAIDIVCLSERVKTGVLRGGEVSHPKYAGRRVFCSGINLKKLHSGEISYSGFLIGREMGCLNKLIHGVADIRSDVASRTVKPWIAVVDTFAIGGGMQMVLACDYVIGEKGSYASLPAAKEGIIPGVSNLRLATATTERFTKRVILQGEKVYAGGPNSDYIFDHVVEKADIEQALERAVELMSAPAVPANKRMITQSKEPLDVFRLYMVNFATEQVSRMYSRDVREKTGKFAQKFLTASR